MTRILRPDPRRLMLPLLAALASLAALAPPAGTPPAAALERPEKARMVLNAERAANPPGAAARVAALVSIEGGWHVNSHHPTYDYLIPTTLEIVLPAGWGPAGIRYPPDQKKRFTFAEQPLAVYDGDVVIQSDLGIPRGAAPGSYPVRAALTYQACNDTQCLPPVTTQAELALVVASGARGAAPPVLGQRGGGPAPARTARPVAATRKGGNGDSVAAILLLGFLGGLILNAMPCVLPVVSLKLFGLVRSAGQGRAAVVRAALASAAGILVSFWVLGAAAIAAAAGGAAVGWGVQFQRPGFIALLAVVVVLFCLNLWGLFEIPLPQALARAGGAAQREGLGGHFASGLFATLMATPCSAPFLGTALGFALAQRAPVILAVFTAVGLGMAFPYLVLAVFPAGARLLPRPGAWMETLRGVLGFLLAGAAVWLLYVLAAQVSPERLALFELGLVGLALLTWIHSRTAVRRPLVFASLALLAVVLVASTPSGGGAGRGGAGAPSPSGARLAGPAAGLIPWVVFDRARAETLAAGGRLIFVDVTADWCFTCKVNERLILDTPEVARAFAEHHVLPMRADWTNRDDAIAAFLAEHGRYGIPFYLLYRPGQEPYVFSELPSKRGLVDAVRQAAARFERAAPPPAPAPALSPAAPSALPAHAPLGASS